MTTETDVRALAEDVPASYHTTEDLEVLREAVEQISGNGYRNFAAKAKLALTAVEMSLEAVDRATREIAKAEGRREGLEEAVAHIDYVRANIVVSFKARRRFTERDLNQAFRNALTIARDRITGEDEGLWLTPEEAAIRALAKAEG